MMTTEQQHRREIARALREAADRIERGQAFYGATFNGGHGDASYMPHGQGMVAALAASPDCHGALSGVLVPVWGYYQITDDCPHAPAEYGPTPELDYYTTDFAPCAKCQHDDDVRNNPRDRP